MKRREGVIRGDIVQHSYWYGPAKFSYEHNKGNLMICSAVQEPRCKIHRGGGWGWGVCSRCKIHGGMLSKYTNLSFPETLDIFRGKQRILFSVNFLFKISFYCVGLK